MADDKVKPEFVIETDESFDEVVVLKNPEIVTKDNAVDVSIAKWEFIVQSLIEGKSIDACGAVWSCGLCLAYYDLRSDAIHCEGCPIYAKTGFKYCRFTPHDSWVAAEDDEDTEHRLASARAMVEFLKGLK